MKNKYWLLALVLLLHLILLVYLKFTAWPEMSLWPYLITKGWLPYRDIAIAHTPLMLIDLGIFYKIFGSGIIQLKIFTWLLILVFDGLIFFIVRELWNKKTAFIALAAFAVWNLFYDGNGLWFDLYMGLIAFLSFYFIQKKKYFWAGVLWACAFISKQTAVWFLIPVGMELIKSKRYQAERIKRFAAGILPVIIPCILIFWVFGILPSFFYWAVKFGIFTLPQAAGQVQLPDIKNLAVSLFPFLIFAPLIWKTGRKNIYLLAWAFAGALGAYPRFEFFHFQPAIPFLAIASGIFFAKNFSKDKLIKTFVIFYALGCVYLLGGYFMRNFREGTRFYETNVTDIVTFVNYNTKKGDRIFVLNWWDNIYPLTDTLPSTKPWIPQLSWYMEIPGIQGKMINDLMADPPKLIIYNPYTRSGLSAYIPQELYNFITENYTISTRVDNLEILVGKKQYAELLK